MDKGRPVLGRIKRAAEGVRRIYHRRVADRLAARDRERAPVKAGGRTRLAFVLKEITYLKAFMPLVRLWEERYRIVFFVYREDEKATSPIRNRRHLERLEPYTRYWFQSAADLAEQCRKEGIVNLITLEAMPLAEEPYTDPGFNVYVITHMTDFNRTLDWYYDKVRFILFHSAYMAGEHAARDREGKFRYTGYSQYLALPELDRKIILGKYDLPEDRRFLFVFGPQKKFYGETKRFIRWLGAYARERGYVLLYKTRKKNPVTPHLRWLLRGCRAFYDESYDPPTSLELMSVSDAVVNFDSTGIQEIVMLEKRVLNIHVKRGYRGMDDIYEEAPVKDLPLETDRAHLFRELDALMEAGPADGMRRLKQAYFPHEAVIRRNYLDLEATFVRE
jgi:hypothetical protein